ncbi:hypothetical protein [Dactylosporangium sp. NPDC050588]|uniref:hypothetical protein n=1 Tax=Dactylosporangium sp. NPDC050588 TaxID=3157211 RepID=UPI0033FDAF76
MTGALLAAAGLLLVVLGVLLSTTYGSGAARSDVAGMTTLLALASTGTGAWRTVPGLPRQPGSRAPAGSHS